MSLINNNSFYDIQPKIPASIHVIFFPLAIYSHIRTRIQYQPTHTVVNPVFYFHECDDVYTIIGDT
jgi:hypothetical protein